MMAIAIPLFSGTLREKWAPFEDRLHTWLRVNRIESAADQRDVLVFAFPLGSPAASYFLLIPQGSSMPQDPADAYRHWIS